MTRFASGAKDHYYGKGDVIVYRLNRTGPRASQAGAVFGARVLMLVYGDAFWRTYTEGDNTGLIATDSMKNFIQRESINFDGCDLEGLCRFLAEKFLRTYSQVEGLQITAEEIPYSRINGSPAFAPAGPERAFTRIEVNRRGLVEAVSGLKGFKLLRLGGSAFVGFVRDEYTTLPELHNRPLHMWLDVDWTYRNPDAAFCEGSVTARVHEIVRQVFATFESGSIQQVIYQMGTNVLKGVTDIAEIHLEANNRTWDTIAEQRDEIGIYTDARPPYGCLGLTLRRT